MNVYELTFMVEDESAASYEVNVVATCMRDAVEEGDLFKKHQTDHIVACRSWIRPYEPHLRFTQSVRSALLPKKPQQATSASEHTK